MNLFNQSLALSTATILVLILISTPLTDYLAPILGFLIVVSVIFIILRQRTIRNSKAEGKREELFVGSNKEVFIITTTLLIAVFLTGGINSSLYFLLYFLLFGIVFLFEPATVFVLLVGLMLVFFQSITEGDLISNLIKLGSLVLLSPISYFFGLEFQKRDKLEKEIEDKTGQIIEDAEVLLKNSESKSDRDIDEIDDIIEKSEELRKNVEDN